MIGGQTSSSVYNGDGLRVSHTVGGATTNFTWDVAAGLPDVLQDGTNTYVYGLGLISSTDGSGNQTYFLHDGLGSTVTLTDGSGNVTATYEYDAFGAVRSQTGSASTPWQFTGQQLDADSALYFLRARFYDPSTGRFLGRDPLPSARSPYAYARNNPVNAADPSGLMATSGDADPSNPVIEDFGGSSANYEGGKMPSYLNCADHSNPLSLFCPSDLIRLADGGIIELPPWEQSLLDGLAALEGGGDAAYATGSAGESNERVVVIGENMQGRVIPYAEKNGATYYKPWSKNPANWLRNNAAWIRRQMREGVRIIDIGPDLTRRAEQGVASKYYEMERRLIQEAGYTKYMWDPQP